MSLVPLLPPRDTAYAQLLDILDALDEAGFYYVISNVGRPRSLMVTVSIPGYLWEIEVMEDGEVELEVFAGGSGIQGLDRLRELLQDQIRGDEV